MNRSIQSSLRAAALALGTLGAAAAASAATDIHVSVGLPMPAPAPVVSVAQPPVYLTQQGYGHDWRDEQRGGRRGACGAARWNPDARYLPGDTVWRRGELYVARRVSAAVWNVNSPPEWTPNYWAPARCSPGQARW
ncbi:hypothetical protein [Ramlibacter sp.]|uniref:hypothetical protein n=1 Tax=Ramlibacter sp. TaxID=1917967 RepID=UPI002C3AED01|nr:hypothetical protein [Ramlibacter sp.]HWI82298.1 hypothetical protein [Ramlibacter sp.]